MIGPRRVVCVGRHARRRRVQLPLPCATVFNNTVHRPATVQRIHIGPRNAPAKPRPLDMKIDRAIFFDDTPKSQ